MKINYLYQFGSHYVGLLKYSKFRKEFSESNNNFVQREFRCATIRHLLVVLVSTIALKQFQSVKSRFIQEKKIEIDLSITTELFNLNICQINIECTIKLKNRRMHVTKSDALQTTQ